jgi:hypothetical protein
MKTTIFKGFVIVFAISLVLQSCTKDLEKINENPNEAALDLASPKMLLPNAIESLTDRVYEIFLGHEMGNCWVQHMAKVQYTDEDRYVPRSGVINTAWSSFYAANGLDVALLKKIANNKGLDNYKGVALVLQAYITSTLTDLFGPVPYTEAWRSAVEDGNILSPAYDTQESIYRSLIDSLELANTLLSTDNEEIEGDILYGGDPDAWKKFANSLRMRLLLRMSSRDEAFVTTELSAMVASPATYPIFESNDDNAQLVYLGSAPNNNPINENRKTRDDHRVSKTVTDILWSNISLVDWRITLFANLDGNDDYAGMPNGLTSAKAAAYNENGLKYTSTLGDYFAEATSPGVLMAYSEVLFMLSEAAHKTYIPGGDALAETHYNDAIYASFNQWGEDLVATSLALDEYYGIGFVKSNWTGDSLALNFMTECPEFNWGAADPMELIGIQKWVAMFDQGLQSWFEWRRIGYPVLTPAEDGMNGGKIPVRVMYPTDEAGRNPTNKDAGVALLGGPDNLNTRVWWDTEDNF